MKDQPDFDIIYENIKNPGPKSPVYGVSDDEQEMFEPPPPTITPASKLSRRKRSATPGKIKTCAHGRSPRSELPLNTRLIECTYMCPDCRVFFHKRQKQRKEGQNVIGLSLFYASVTLPYHKDEVYGFIKLTREQEATYLSPLGDKIGRLISGFSVGLGILIPIILLSEISTIKTRSSLSNTCNLAINFGALGIYLFNMVVPAEHLSYCIIAPSIGFLALCYFLPESPHWQISTGRTEAAKENYSYLRGPDYEGLEAEVDEVIQVKERTVSGNKSRWTSRGFLHPMGILAFLFSVIGLCGLDAPITFYGPKMFAEFGFHIPYQYVVLMIPVGSFIGYIVAIPLLAIMKKKHQYNMCALFMAFSTACLGIAYYIEPNEDLKYVAQILLSFGALGVTFGYGVGLGSVVYCLPGELLAPEDKALGTACAEFFRLIWTAGILKVYPLCLSLVGYPVMFGFHTSILLVSVWFVWSYLPETKDKSLSELQAIFYMKKKEATSV